MATQTATTGNLEHAQNIVIAQCLIATEHNQPCVNLVNRFRLGKGEKSLTVPRVGQVDAQNLTDGVDLVTTADIGLDYETASPDEVGLKFILTDKLVRQFNEDVFKLIGTQMGNAMARKRDKDVITLFASLTTHTLGIDNASLILANASGAVAYATANKFPRPIVFVHHPNAVAKLSLDMQGQRGAAGTVYVPVGLSSVSEQLLKDYWSGVSLDRINFYQDGNIEKYSTVDSGYGAMFGRGCLGFCESLAPTTERERDASLRAYEVVMVSDYKAFEINADWGARAQYEIGALTHNSTKA